MTAEFRPGDRYRGFVADFDADRGLGVVIDAEGNRYAFHCLEIADGSRTIDVGLDVGFEVLPKLGRYEAKRIRP